MVALSSPSNRLGAETARALDDSEHQLWPGLTRRRLQPDRRGRSGSCLFAGGNGALTRRLDRSGNVRPVSRDPHEGGALGLVLGTLLSSLISGPGNRYPLNVRAPDG